MFWANLTPFSLQYGFEGFTVSDCGGVPAINTGHYMTASPAQALTRALHGGLDSPREVRSFRRPHHISYGESLMKYNEGCRNDRLADG
jgi:hypothetical protein